MEKMNKEEEERRMKGEEKRRKQQMGFFKGPLLTRDWRTFSLAFHITLSYLYK